MSLLDDVVQLRLIMSLNRHTCCVVSRNIHIKNATTIIKMLASLNDVQVV